MRTRITSRRRPGGLLKVIAGTVAVLYLAVAALAVCPVLHQALHGDANQPGHQCAASVLAKGQLDVPACEAPSGAPLVWGPEPCLPLISVRGAMAELLPLGRAPPFAS